MFDSVIHPWLPVNDIETGCGIPRSQQAFAQCCFSTEDFHCLENLQGYSGFRDQNVKMRSGICYHIWSSSKMIRLKEPNNTSWNPRNCMFFGACVWYAYILWIYIYIYVCMCTYIYIYYIYIIHICVCVCVYKFRMFVVFSNLIPLKTLSKRKQHHCKH